MKRVGVRLSVPHGGAAQATCAALKTYTAGAAPLSGSVTYTLPLPSSVRPVGLVMHGEGMPAAATHVMVSIGALLLEDGVGVGDGLAEGEPLGVGVGVGDAVGEPDGVGAGEGVAYTVTVPLPLLAT